MAINSIDDLLTDAQEAAIQQQARDMYTPAYNAAVLAANQGYGSQVSSLNADLTAYEQSAEKSKVQTEKAVVNSAIKRGTARGSRTDYDIAESLGDIAEMVLARRKQVGDQLASLAANKESTLAQLSADFETNVMNQAYSLTQQAIQNAMWLAEFNRSNRGGGGGSTTPSVSAEDVYNSGSSTSAGTVPTAMGGGVPLPTYSSGSVSSTFTGSRNGQYYINGKAVSASSYWNYKQTTDYQPR